MDEASRLHLPQFQAHVVWGRSCALVGPSLLGSSLLSRLSDARTAHGVLTYVTDKYCATRKGRRLEEKTTAEILHSIAEPDLQRRPSPSASHLEFPGLVPPPPADLEPEPKVRRTIGAFSPVPPPEGAEPDEPSDPDAADDLSAELTGSAFPEVAAEMWEAEADLFCLGEDFAGAPPISGALPLLPSEPALAPSGHTSFVPTDSYSAHVGRPLTSPVPLPVGAVEVNGTGIYAGTGHLWKRPVAADGSDFDETKVVDHSSLPISALDFERSQGTNYAESMVNSYGQGSSRAKRPPKKRKRIGLRRNEAIRDRSRPLVHRDKLLPDRQCSFCWSNHHSKKARPTAKIPQMADCPV